MNIFIVSFLLIFVDKTIYCGNTSTIFIIFNFHHKKHQLSCILISQEEIKFNSPSKFLKIKNSLDLNFPGFYKK